MQIGKEKEGTTIMPRRFGGGKTAADKRIKVLEIAGDARFHPIIRKPWVEEMSGEPRSAER